MTDITDWLDAEGTPQAHEARDLIEALRQRVKELEGEIQRITQYWNDRCAEMDDKLAACEKERDEYKLLAHKQFTEWHNDIEKLVAMTRELDTANAALDAKIDICGDERVTELKDQLAAVTKERDELQKYNVKLECAVTSQVQRIKELEEVIEALK